MFVIDKYIKSLLNELDEKIKVKFKILWEIIFES